MALEPLPIDTCLTLNGIGAQLNCAAIIGKLMFDRKNCFDKNWFDLANLIIQSIHNSAGALLNNTTTVADPTILMPVQDGAAANYRKPNM